MKYAQVSDEILAPLEKKTFLNEIIIYDLKKKVHIAIKLLSSYRNLFLSIYWKFAIKKRRLKTIERKMRQWNEECKCEGIDVLSLHLNSVTLILLSVSRVSSFHLETNAVQKWRAQLYKIQYILKYTSFIRLFNTRNEYSITYKNTLTFIQQSLLTMNKKKRKSIILNSFT